MRQIVQSSFLNKSKDRTNLFGNRKVLTLSINRQNFEGMASRSHFVFVFVFWYFVFILYHFILNGILFSFFIKNFIIAPLKGFLEKKKKGCVWEFLLEIMGFLKSEELPLILFFKRENNKIRNKNPFVLK